MHQRPFGPTNFVLFLLFLLLSAHSAFAGEINLPCEVMEAFGPLQTGPADAGGTCLILLHHSNSTDRTTLGNWLKTRSGTEVTFTLNHKQYHGILCRLSHCFGRGLLIYKGNIIPGHRAIISVALPTSP